MKDVEMCSRGKLSIVSNRKTSFEGYGNQVQSELFLASSSVSPSLLLRSFGI